MGAIGREREKGRLTRWQLSVKEEERERAGGESTVEGKFLRQKRLCCPLGCGGWRPDEIGKLCRRKEEDAWVGRKPIELIIRRKPATECGRGEMAKPGQSF